MKTFKDLKFEPHSVCDGVQARMNFHNEQWISVVGAEKGLYGNGVTSFEIYSSSTIKTKRQVKGWRTKDQITNHMKYLQKK
tara:strand:+ start:497 stop:739 length:243 start_codon:yes stop_codon:yes gene_type:complete